MKINKFHFISKELKEELKPKKDPLCPECICFGFDPFESNDSRFKDMIYLTVWGCISYRHLRDQFFNDLVDEFVKEIKEKRPTVYQDFKQIVYYMGMSKYGQEYGVLLDDFWEQLWIYVKQQLFKDSGQMSMFEEKKLEMKIKIEKRILESGRVVCEN